MASSSTSMLLPASLSKKVLVLIVGEDGVGKTTLLQRLISLEDPFTSSTFFPPTSLSTPPTTLSSPSTSTSSLQTPFQFSASMAKISDTSLFTGVKIYPGLGQEGPVWVEFLVVPPQLSPTTRAMLYQGTQGIVGVYQGSDLRSYELCWKRIGHVCEVLGVSVWHSQLSEDPTALPVCTVAMDSTSTTASSPSRSRMTPFEVSWSHPSFMKVVNEFLNQLLIQRTLLKNTTTTTTNGINRYPMSPSDTIRRNQHGLLKQRSNSHF